MDANVRAARNGYSRGINQPLSRERERTLAYGAEKSMHARLLYASIPPSVWIASRPINRDGFLIAARYDVRSRRTRARYLSDLFARREVI